MMLCTTEVAKDRPSVKDRRRALLGELRCLLLKHRGRGAGWGSRGQYSVSLARRHTTAAVLQDDRELRSAWLDGADAGNVHTELLERGTSLLSKLLFFVPKITPALGEWVAAAIRTRVLAGEADG